MSLEKFALSRTVEGMKGYHGKEFVYTRHRDGSGSRNRDSFHSAHEIHHQDSGLKTKDFTYSLHSMHQEAPNLRYIETSHSVTSQHHDSSTKNKEPTHTVHTL